MAFVQTLREQGHFEAAKAVDQIRKNPTELGPKVKVFLKNENQPKKWTNLEALAWYFDLDMSVSEYKSQRININRTSGINSVPCWDTLYSEKLKCGIDKHFIIQTQNNIQCPMQVVCKNSFFRILEDFQTKEQLDTLIEIHGAENIKLILYFKFGTDGSSGHMGKIIVNC